MSFELGSCAGQHGPAPRLVLPLDQAEELFSADAGAQAEQFLALLAELQGRVNATEVGLIVAATIRTDRYELMQNHPALDGVGAVLFNELKPMPPSEFKEVIIGPASRSELADQPVRFAPDLIERLLADAAEGADTLPLLSLTLARLYTDWLDVGAEELTLTNLGRYSSSNTAAREKDVCCCTSGVGPVAACGTHRNTGSRRTKQYLRLPNRPGRNAPRTVSVCGEHAEGRSTNCSNSCRTARRRVD